jgi:hypothetical protein
MSTSQATHTEEWKIRITADQDSEWPDTAVRHGTARFRPDQITFTLQRGGICSVHLSGQYLKKDGNLSQRRAVAHYFGADGCPDWAQEEIARARYRHNLTDEALGRPA